VDASTEVNERRLIDQVVGRLIDRFSALDPVTVLWVVQKIHARYNGRPVRDYIPLFVERHAVAELDQLPITVDSRTAAPLAATG
jgi:hypothetical protein